MLFAQYVLLASTSDRSNSPQPLKQLSRLLIASFASLISLSSSAGLSLELLEIPHHLPLLSDADNPPSTFFLLEM